MADADKKEKPTKLTEQDREVLIKTLGLTPFKIFMRSRPLKKRLLDVAPLAVETATLVLQQAVDEFFVDLHAWVLRGSNVKIETREITWPANWREHLKLALYGWRLWPDWFKQRWPVKLHVETIPFEQKLHLCPHVRYPEGSAKHLAWLLDQDMLLARSLAHIATLYGQLNGRQCLVCSGFHLAGDREQWNGAPCPVLEAFRFYDRNLSLIETAKQMAGE